MLKKLREPINGFTHFLGIIFAIAAFILLQTRNNLPLTDLHVVTFTIYTLAMFALFSASTLYQIGRAHV